jgi:uncharacterized protein (TIGR01777 family)
VVKKKIVAMAGSSGLIGNAIMKALEGYEVRPITRNDFKLNDNEFIRKFEIADILMNFAGESIIMRWNSKNKKKILESRIGTTRKIGLITERGLKKQRLYLTASAIGIYGRDRIHDENSSDMADGFMAEVVRQWENEANRIRSKMTRVCILRLGVVLSERGGLIKRLKMFFKTGLGAVMGDGSQYFSFIHIDDLTGIVKHLIKNTHSKGIYNIVAPESKTNTDFSHIFARALNRKIRLRIPERLLRIILGEASAVLTEGQSVYPRRIIDSGYNFRYPSLEDTLKDIVN